MALADSGRAIASGEQTLVTSINSLSVGGTLSGNYQQTLSGDESTAGGMGALKADAVSQTIVSSINTIGSLNR